MEIDMIHDRQLVCGWLPVAVCALFGVLLACCAPALAARGHVFGGSFGEAGAGNGQFSHSNQKDLNFTGPQGVAVNESTGDVYVVDIEDGRVEYFGATGAYLGQFNGSGTLPGEGKAAPGGQLTLPHAVAVDNSTNPADPSKGDVYVTDNGQSNTKEKAIDKFTATGEYIGQITGTPIQHFGGTIEGLAVDPSGKLWVDYEGYLENDMASFNDALANEFIGEIVDNNRQFGDGFLSWGLAVDAQDNLYVKGDFDKKGQFIGSVNKINGSGQLIKEEVGSAPADWPAVESSTEDVYLGNTTSVGRFGQAETPLEHIGAGHLSNATGIAVDASSETVYVADSATDTVDIFAPEPPGPPTVEGEFLTGVGARAAGFVGEVNPRGAATTYSVEYGRCGTLETCASSPYEASVPGATLAAGFEVSRASVQLEGLEPYVPYHVRLVAQNEHDAAPVDGVETVFVTQSLAGPLVLPDGRRWELVSPPDKLGGQIFPVGVQTGAVEQASAAGDAISYVSSRPSESGPGGFSGVEQLLSRRGPDGWSTSDISMPHSAPTGFVIGSGFEFYGFSEDLSLGFTETLGAFSPPPEGAPVGAFPEPTERTPFERHNYAQCVQAPSECFEPLVTGAAGYADVGAGVKFGGDPAISHGPVQFVEATPDGEHVILHSNIALTGEPAPGGGLYEWSAQAPATERLRLVAVGGGTQLGSKVAGDGLFARRAVSADGTRVFFSSSEGGVEHLYARYMVSGERIALDVGESGSGGGFFQAANTEGSKVFFTDGIPLLKGSGSGDLYECDIVVVEQAGGSKLKCELHDLTPVPPAGSPGAGESAEVAGYVLGASEDGEYVYFAASGVQAPGATPGTCSLTHAAICNLYVRHDGASALVTKLDGGDSPDWLPPEDYAMPVRVSPNGLWLAFMSDRSLTGYDNRDAVSGKPDEEVYLYSAASGRLVCASCNPSGARPVGVLEPPKAEEGQRLADTSVWHERWVAANVPGWTNYDGNDAAYQSRYLSNEGRLFFNSVDALAPQDSNGEEDVYEYEPAGVGGVDGCTASLTTFSQASDGCVGLISSGVSSGESAFLDASANGSDVFFLTLGKLVPGDVDTALDVYDAHACSASSPCAPEPPPPSLECRSAAACRTAPGAQPSIYGAPASQTFSGSGDVSASGPAPAVRPRVLTRAQRLAAALRVCRGKRSRSKRAACEAHARRLYGAKGSRAAARGGRAGR